MKDHSYSKRQFIQLSRSWYADAILKNKPEDFVDDITVGFYTNDGGTTGEFTFEWLKFGHKVFVKLVAYDDSWSALYQFSDLLEAMAEIDDENISPKDFCKLLISLGIEDNTKEKSPYNENLQTL